MRINNLFYLMIVMVLFSGCIEPRNFVALENRVAAIEMENNRQLSLHGEQDQLQQAIDTIEQRLNKGHSISQEEYAELKYDIQVIKKNIQRVKGSIEEIYYTFEMDGQNRKEINKRLERLDLAISKNYEKVIRLEQYMGFEPSVHREIEKNLVASEEPKKNDEKKLYDFAKKLFDDGDKENARIQFENFINKYPNSDNADNARFWIADSYYSEKWFEKAILEYQKVLEEYPDSNKLAAARLKQGYAFAELGEKANARLILKEVFKKHPDSNEAKYAQKKLETLK